MDHIIIQPHADGLYRLTARQQFPRPLAEIFAFFAEPVNLEALTPPWVGFEILTPAPIEMREGALIDYRLHIHHVPVRWQTEITAYQPGVRFVDEQRRGPYRTWIHEHLFTERGGHTHVLDLVRYYPAGGRLVNALFVQPDLHQIFAFRQQALARRFGANQH